MIKKKEKKNQEYATSVQRTKTLRLLNTHLLTSVHVTATGSLMTRRHYFIYFFTDHLVRLTVACRRILFTRISLFPRLC